MAQERRDGGLSIGASGASIEIRGDYALKCDVKNPDRMQVQYALMKEVGPKAFPHVYSCGQSCYVMERLEPLVWTDDRCEGLILFEMRDLLPVIWGQYLVRKLQAVLPVMHVEYMRPRWGPYHRRMERWLDKLMDLDVTYTTHIHGDPTVENVMQRGTEIVFIDPIPANHYIPSTIGVDLGKMMQSIFGYESMVRPESRGLTLVSRMTTADELLSAFTDADAAVAQYFFCVHIARLIPYQRESDRAQFWDLLTHAIEVFEP